MALLGSSQLSVQAATPIVFNVNDDQDNVDHTLNGKCSIRQAEGGPCTLRAAISEANGNVVDRNIIIELPAGVYNLTIPPAALYSDNQSGDLNINVFTLLHTNSITIEPLNSGKVVIKNTIKDRILSVSSNLRVLINNITMQNGQVLIDPLLDSRGGGAIYNEGNLYLSGVSLLNNKVKCSSTKSCTSELIGGAILNLGTLSLTDSTLDSNEAERGSAIFNVYAAPGNKLSIQYSTISNNVNRNAVTIVNYSEMTILNSTFSGNNLGFGGI